MPPVDHAHTDIGSKVSAVLSLLRDVAYVVPSTRTKIMSNDRKALLELLNRQRTKRRHPGQVHLPNLSKYLKHPELSPPGFLAELTCAVGLSDLGFDETVWNLVLPTLRARVRDALSGGVLQTVLRHAPHESLFQLFPKLKKGLLLDDVDQTPSLFAAIPEFTVHAGDRIETKANLPFKGYLRVFAGEEDQFMGLNTYLGIPAGSIESGTYQFEDAPTSAKVPRTIIYAFAARELAFDAWPTTHDKSSRLSHGRFLELVGSFFDLHEDTRASSVQSFLTTAPCHVQPLQ